jgi:GNAT superfamily N-acetyltransferase
MHYLIAEISREDEIWDALVQAAQSISEAVARQLEVEIESARSNHILVAMVDEQPVGLLRFITWRLGEDEGRPEIIFNGKTLTEAKVISFGVLPDYRNQGIGRALQKKAMELARAKGCYQLRSRSRYQSQANHHLKISLGSAIQPSLEDDSVYFIIVL